MFLCYKYTRSKIIGGKKNSNNLINIYDLYFVICNNLMTEHNKRKYKNQELDNEFGFLYKSVLNSSEIIIKIE